MNQHHTQPFQTQEVKGHIAKAVERWFSVQNQLQCQHDYDQVAEEQAIALVYNGISYAVMMATADHLEEFALGFSLSEGLIQHPNEIYDIEVVQDCAGWLVNIELSSQRFMELKERRRNLTGRTGCGLCGAESLEQAIRPAPAMPATPCPTPEAIATALDQLPEHQLLKKATGATHAAAWCDNAGNVLAVREDLGRHNALDKLIGHLYRSGFKPEQSAETQDTPAQAKDKQQSPYQQGFTLISSRASYEMVQKASSTGLGSLVAISAPTSLAIEKAQQSQLNLVAYARPDRFVVYHRSQPLSDTQHADSQQDKDA